MKKLTILDAIRDPNLFGAFIGKDLSSWVNWITALRVLYGLPVLTDRSAQLIRQCMGRDRDLLPDDGFQTALFLTGRRSGKSRIAACIGAFEGALAGHESKLAKGEKGIVAVLAPTRAQAKIVHGYLKAIFEAPVLNGEVVGEADDRLDLANGISIQVMAGDWRSVRGFTLVAAIVDEACFFGVTEESKVRSDSELIQAIRPGLATTGGKLIAISSPYAKKGWAYSMFQKHHGKDKGRVLVWNAPSLTMNCTLPQSVVDDAMAEDLAAAKAEYLGEFRDDVAAYLTREVVEAVVVKERTEIRPDYGTEYSAFVDLSGGRSDDSALCIAHREERVVVVDLLRRYRPPSNPYAIIGEMVEELKRYELNSVVGDNYSAEFVASAFEERGIHYIKSEKNKSALYLELLPRISASEIELLDEPVSVSQLAHLERRTRSGGKDIVDHPRGGRDDLANVIAGVADVASTRRAHTGALFSHDEIYDECETLL